MSSRPSLSAYTPSNTDPAVLKRIFVQREKLLERIIDRLRRSVTSGDRHHILLVGPRGSGKTHLVSLAEWELRNRAELSESMRIAWLGEDDSFTGLVHLAFGIAKRLSEEYPAEFPDDFKTPVRGLSPDDAALAVLQSIVEQLQKKSLILITENLDQTFRGLGDSGQKKWRAFLQETRKISTLATSQQLFAGVSDRKEAFFGFFDIHHLEPLNFEQARVLIGRISVEQNKPDLARYLGSAEGRFRVRALHYLAGGNHRIYVLLSEFLTKDSLEDLVSAFENLAHDMTPYFQERMRSLPDQQRQLAQCLCDADGALTVKQISEETFIDDRSCSKQLGNLKAKGFVRSEKRGKESYYDMAEPLMRLCLEIKNQRGRPLKMVARFLRAWFPMAELQSWQGGIISSRLNEYCLEAMESGGQFKLALAEKLKTEIDQHIDQRRYNAAKDLTEELGFADEVAALEVEADLASKQSDFETAIAKLTALIGLPNASAHQKASALLFRSSTHLRRGDTDQAMSDWSALIDMRGASSQQRIAALLNRAGTYDELSDLDFAIADYSSVVEMEDSWVDQKAIALFYRGVKFSAKGDLGRSSEDYSLVISMPNVSPEIKDMAILNRGNTHAEQGDLDSALGDYACLIATGVGTYQKSAALLFRGVIYGQQGNHDAALEDLSLLISTPKAPEFLKAKAMLSRGIAYWRNKEYRKSAAEFEAVLAFDSLSLRDRTSALFNVVEPMVDYCKPNEVLKALKRAFVEGDSELSGYGGTPRDLLKMILQCSPAEWPDYILQIAPLYVEHGVAEKLGQGVTHSIEYLDKGGFSETQIEAWNSAWQDVGKGCQDLEIPLRCLDAAVEVINSNPANDRPLFRLPLEIRRLVRPLLNESLGES